MGEQRIKESKQALNVRSNIWTGGEIQCLRKLFQISIEAAETYFRKEQLLALQSSLIPSSTEAALTYSRKEELPLLHKSLSM